MLRSLDIIEYDGAGHSGVLNRLLAENIKVYKAVSNKKKLIIYTKSADRQKIIVIFDGLCYNYKIIKSVGVKAFADFLKKRWILPVGFGLITAMLLTISSFVFRIEIYSEAVDKAAVYEVLERCGVKRGSLTRRIDAAELGKAVAEIGGVAFADVSVKGSTVVIKLHEELPEVNIFEVSGNKSLVSMCDAVITRQIVFSGSAVKKRGDIVRKGETLISSEVQIGEDKTTQLTAVGEVYGLVTYKASILFGENRVERVKSGNTHTETVISFLGLTGKIKGSPFAMYESRSESFTSGWLAPLKIKKITYFEIVDRQISETFTEAEPRLIKEALAMAQQGVPDGAVIRDRQTKIRQAGGNYIVEAVITAEQRIDNSVLT